MKELNPPERIEQKIYLIRGQKVMTDSHLASLYGVETKYLLRAVKRNMTRFPLDFAYRLTMSEFRNLRCHFSTSSQWGGRRYLPYVFTEQGVAMLSSVLKSKRAVQVNIEIMRAFVKPRMILGTHVELARKFKELEMEYNAQFRVVFDTIQELMAPHGKGGRSGFHIEP